MVSLSACSTRWTAGAAHPCWGIPTGYGLRGERLRSMGYMPPLRPKPAKSLAAQAPQGFGAAPHGDCTHTAVLHTRRMARLG
jgi:hypothetical protein